MEDKVEDAIIVEPVAEPVLSKEEQEAFTKSLSEIKEKSKFVPIELKRIDMDKNGNPLHIYKRNYKNTNKYSPQKIGV